MGMITYINQDNADISINIYVAEAADEVSGVAFVDNTDDAEFDPETLAPNERGLIFRYQRQLTGRVLVYMPYTMITVEIAEGLRGLQSFLAEAPYNENTPHVVERLRKFWGVAGNKFSLDHKEFQKFLSYGEGEGWVFLKGLISFASISAKIAAAGEKIVGIHAAFQAVRNEVLASDEVDDEHFSSVCHRLDEINGDIAEIDNTDVVAEAVAAAETATTGERVALQTQIDRLSVLTGKVHQLDTAGVAKVAAGKNKKSFVERSLNDLLGVSLSGELSRLHPVFSSMSIIRAISDNKIEIRLGAGTVTFDGEVFTVEGDIGSIARATTAPAETVSLGSRLRNVRAITTPGTE